MKTLCIVLLCLTSVAAAEPFPEIPEGPIEKVHAWRILEQQWRIIEHLLFTEAGKVIFPQENGQRSLDILVH